MMSLYPGAGGQSTVLDSPTGREASLREHMKAPMGLMALMFVHTGYCLNNLNVVEMVCTLGPRFVGWLAQPYCQHIKREKAWDKCTSAD